MRTIPRRPAAATHRMGLLAGLLCACLSLGLAGCLTDDDESDAGSDKDPFPKPNGPKILPLEENFNSIYNYVELDSGRVYQRIPQLFLYVTRRSGDIFGYAFENPGKGYLIRYLDLANRDSTGVYIVGTFDGLAESLDSVPTLWLPQHPRSGVTWDLAPGRAMELVSPDQAYLTGVLFPYDTADAPVVQGFQRHSTLHFKETAGDTVTHYYLRKGVGILGFERSAGGSLIASGTLGFFTRVGRTSL